MKKKYEVGNIVTGYVTGIENYGIFISLDDYYSGLIHISEISDSFVRNINDYVSIGETINARILEVDAKNNHVKLSIKNMEYRTTQKNKRLIKETKHGFSSLKSNLSVWIAKKESVLLQKNKKN